MKTAKELFEKAEDKFSSLSPAKQSKLYELVDKKVCVKSIGLNSNEFIYFFGNKKPRFNVQLIMNTSYHALHDDSFFVDTFYAIVDHKIVELKDCLIEHDSLSLHPTPNQSDYIAAIAYMIFKEISNETQTN